MSLGFDQAIEALQGGRADAAREILDRTLATDFRDPDALHLMARLTIQSDPARAALLLQRAIHLSPRNAVLRNDLGAAYRFAGRLQEAAAALESALLFAANDADAWHNLGMTRRALGDLDGAATALRRALAMAERPMTLMALGAVCDARTDHAGALAAFRRAAELDPESAEAFANLGIASARGGDDAGAVVAMERAVALDPSKTQSWLNLGLFAVRAGRAEIARAALDQVLAREPAHDIALPEAVALAADGARAAQLISTALARLPDSVVARRLRARLLLAAGDAAAALVDIDAALRVGETAPLLADRALALRALRRPGEAVKAAERAIARDDGEAVAHFALGAARFAQGRMADAQAAFRASLAREPAQPAVRSALLYALQYEPGITAARLAADHREWDRLHGARAPAPAHANTRDPDRRLRVGFVSGDFNRHPVGWFLRAVLPALDRGAIDPYLVSSSTIADEVTRELRGLATWIDAAPLSDEALDARIRQMNIDILIDMAGHTAFNRLSLFARKPAPVQMTWAGYVGTTGLAAIDWLIADRHHVPAGEEEDYVEHVLRLPHGYVPYAAPANAPAISWRPRDNIIFAAFHNPAKIGAVSIALWAGVLTAVPSARLLLKFAGLDDPETRARIESAFAAHAIEPDRLVFEGAAPHTALLARYNDCDIALDPTPYSGGLTTLEALWMGVPVVTLPGASFAGRHSLSHLTVAGHGELVARDAADYVRIAADLARDRVRLGRYRADLRGALSRSPICDVSGFARDFTAALRQAWRGWINT